MPDLSDLPRELHAMIARDLLPPVLDGPSCIEMDVRCRADDLEALSHVSRQWHSVCAEALSFCVFRLGTIEWCGRSPKRLLRSIAAPSKVEHLHLSTDAACAESIGPWTAPFPSVHAVEILDMDVSGWKPLLAGLLHLPRLHTVIFRDCNVVAPQFGPFSDQDRQVYPQFTDGIDHPLLGVKTLIVTEIGSVVRLHCLLRWFPGVARLKAEIGEDSWEMEELDEAILQCADGLQSLDIIWRLYGDDNDLYLPGLDLQGLKALQEITLHLLIANGNCPRQWRFPESVRRIMDVSFIDKTPWPNARLRSGLRKLVKHQREIAPGLQELELSVSDSNVDARIDTLQQIWAALRDKAQFRLLRNGVPV